MDKTNQILYNILNARENRALVRSQFVKKNLCTLSLSLNITGYPKSNKLLTLFFTKVLNELKPFLVANRIKVEHKNELIINDEAGDFFIVPFSISSLEIIKIKELTETFEATHALGRLIDIDIFNEEGLPVSSGKKKPCYFCGEYAAISCMRNKRHTYKEIREKIVEQVTNYLANSTKEKLVNKLTALATKAILYEISVSPKPGLVSYENSGAHTDMNFFTFLNSSASLTPFFKEFCLLGYQYSGKYEDVLGQIRQIGLRAEKTMFKATNDINTHKGVIFIFGIALFSISKLASKEKGYNDDDFIKIAKKICKNIVANELLSNKKKAITHGEKVYEKYGLLGAGVRKEVEDGFPSVFHKSLNHFTTSLNISSFNNQHEIQQILQTALLHIMSINNDSNILYRSNLETLKEFQNLAKEAINNNNLYQKLCDFCIEKKISPGGSADLLSVSLLLYFVKTEEL